MSLNKKTLILILLSLLNVNCVNTTKKTTKNLMIVAHPDDESIFGGNHILKENYFIICLTNNKNKIRRLEFEKMLKESGNEGIILSFPDKVKGRRSNWKKEEKEIKEILKRYIISNDWDQIVTHNKEGEYGHIHHKLTNAIVTQLCEETNNSDVLYYFGKFYPKNKLTIDIKKISNNDLEEKENLINGYVSQKYARNKLMHSYAYENWIKYK